MVRHCVSVLLYTWYTAIVLAFGGSRYPAYAAHLEVLIDAPRTNADVKAVKATHRVAEQASWQFGTKLVHQRATWLGLRGQWMSAWRPASGDPPSSVIILEDDLLVSEPYFLFLSQMVCSFGDQPDLAGISLQRAVVVQRQTFYQNVLRALRLPSPNEPFLYKAVGPWGFAPLQEPWRRFLEWWDSSDCDTVSPTDENLQAVLTTRCGDLGSSQEACRRQFACDARLGVEDLASSKWFSTAIKLNKTNSLWTPFFNRFSEISSLYTLYPNLTEQGFTLVSNRRLRGEHHSGTRGPDFDPIPMSEYKQSFHHTHEFEFSALRRLGWDADDDEPQGKPVGTFAGSPVRKLLSDGLGPAEQAYFGSGFELTGNEGYNEAVAPTPKQDHGNELAADGYQVPPWNVDFWNMNFTTGQRSLISSYIALHLAITARVTRTLSPMRVCPNSYLGPLSKGDSHQQDQPPDTLGDCTELVNWLLLAFIGEVVVPSEPIKHGNSDVFFCVLLVAGCLSLMKIRRISVTLPLNRDQTEEWKGWMQIAFVTYHVAGYEPAYVPIRAFVAAYLWLTGFGNAMYMQKTGDYSLKRIFSMLWRINFLVMFLSIATSVPWILYYVCALHSVHFLMITVFGLLGGFGNSPCCNRLPGVSRITPSEGQRTVCTAFIWVFGLCCFTGSIELVWNKQLWPGWVAPALRWTLGERFAAYFEYRTYMDRFSSLPGIILALCWPAILLIYGRFESRHPNRGTDRVANTDSNDASPAVYTSLRMRHLRFPVTAFAVALFAASVVIYARLRDSPARYQELHPFLGTIWVYAYLIVRNLPRLRDYIFVPLEFVGKHSLEFYLLQFHFILSKEARQQLVLIPGARYTNLMVLCIIYVFGSWRCHGLTTRLKDAFLALRIQAVVALLASSSAVVILNFLLPFAWAAPLIGLFAAVPIVLQHPLIRLLEKVRIALKQSCALQCPGLCAWGVPNTAESEDLGRDTKAAAELSDMQQTPNSNEEEATIQEPDRDTAVDLESSMVPGKSSDSDSGEADDPDAAPNDHVEVHAQANSAQAGGTGMDTEGGVESTFKNAKLVAKRDIVLMLIAFMSFAIAVSHFHGPLFKNEWAASASDEVPAVDQDSVNRSIGIAKNATLDIIRNLESYYGGSDILRHSAYLQPGNSLYTRSIDFLANKIARAIVHKDRFVVAAMGSSVTAGHDNCNYDSYPNQLLRTLSPVFSAAGVVLEVRNAGMGGACGDDFRNQVFCVKDIAGEDVDVLHYSWNHFEAGKDYATLLTHREMLVRWALMMPRSPAVHIMNTDELSSDEECGRAYGTHEMFDAYAQYGANVICLQTGLLLSGKWKGIVWGEVGNGIHRTTRYGELANITQSRRESLGVMFRNWHPGPLGFQLVADAFAYLYSHALLRALDLVSSTDSAMRSSIWPRTPVLLARSSLPAPLYCNPSICSLEYPPGCVYYEIPSYGRAQIAVVPADYPDNPLSSKNDSGWFHWIGPKREDIPRDEQMLPECQHLDRCGAMQPRNAQAGWLVFALPAHMTAGKIFVCCCCGQQCVHDAFVKTRAEFWFDGETLDPASFQIWPVTHGFGPSLGGKCLLVLDGFKGPLKTQKGGRLFLGVKVNEIAEQPVANAMGISHVVAF